MNAFISSLYVGYALYAMFPYTAVVRSWGTTPILKYFFVLGIYIVCVAIAFVVLRRFVNSSFRRSFLPMAVLALLALGFVLAMLYHVFGVTALFNLPSFIDSLFAPNSYFFYWFIAPLVGLFFFAR